MITTASGKVTITIARTARITITVATTFSSAESCAGSGTSPRAILALVQARALSRITTTIQMNASSMTALPITTTAALANQFL